MPWVLSALAEAPGRRAWPENSGEAQLKKYLGFSWKLGWTWRKDPKHLTDTHSSNLVSSSGLDNELSFPSRKNVGCLLLLGSCRAAEHSRQARPPALRAFCTTGMHGLWRKWGLGKQRPAFWLRRHVEDSAWEPGHQVFSQTHLPRTPSSLWFCEHLRYFLKHFYINWLIFSFKPTLQGRKDSFIASLYGVESPEQREATPATTQLSWWRRSGDWGPGPQLPWAASHARTSLL